MIDLSKLNGLNVDSTDLTVTLDGFTYVSGSATYSNSGSWCSGTKGEPSVSGNTLTWDSSQINEITDNGSITINVKKDCSDDASVSASSNYEDNCGKDHSASADASSLLVKSAILYAKITPQLNWAGTHTVDWKAYFTNGGDGTAREVVLHTNIGTGLAFNKDGAYIEINGHQYNYNDSAITWPADGANGDLEWKLNNLTIDPSQKITLYFKTDVNSCDENNLSVETYADWCTNCTNNCEGCAESNHSSGQVRTPVPYALVVIDGASFTSCRGGNVQLTVSDPGTTDLYNTVIVVDLPKYIKYESGSAQYTLNGSSAKSAGDPDISSITSGNYSGGYELKWDSNKIAKLSDIEPGDSIVLTFNISPDDSQANPSCEFVENGYQKIESYLEFAKPCDVNKVDQNSVKKDVNIDVKHPNLSVVSNTISVNNNTYHSNHHYFPKELGTNITFEVDITNNGDAATVKTNFADLLKGNNQHPLDYQSAQYSYDGGSWTDVPWDTADSTNGILVWNNIEGDLGNGNGIEPGKTLKIQITAKVDSACSENTAYNYAEVWTGCTAMGDIASDGGNLKGNATGVSGWNGSLTADCPIYQAKYARNKSHDNSWNLIYSHSVSDDVYACDKDVQYEITFTNNDLAHSAVTIYGPITIYDLIPVGTTYVANSSVVTLPDNSTLNIEPISGTETLNGTQYTKLSWSLPSDVNLAPGKTVKVDFNLDFGNCSEVNTTAVNRQRLLGYNCAGSSGTQYSYPSNYSWTHKTGGWVATTHVKKSNMVIQVSVDKSSASQGDTVLYMIHLKNEGDGNSNNFKIKDPVPNGLTVITTSITDGPPPGWGDSYDWMTHSYNTDTSTNTVTITWQSTDNANNNEFLAGAETTVSFKATVNTDNFDTTSNCITFTDDCCYKDGIKICAELIADLSLTKTCHDVTAGLPDKQDLYTITINNNGPSDALNVSLTDNLPAGISNATYTLNGGSETPWSSPLNLGTIPKGSTYTVEIYGKVNINTPNSIHNEAEVSSDTPDPNSNNNSAGCDNNVVHDADLSLKKTAKVIVNKGPVKVEFRIIVLNSGPAIASNVSVKDILPSGYSYLSYSASQGVYNNLTGVWEVGDILNGSTAELTIVANLLINGDHTNSAEIIHSDKPDPDSTPNNHDPNEDDQASVTPKFPVGGTVYPVNKFTLILPWLLLFFSLAFMAYLLYKKRRLSLKK